MEHHQDEHITCAECGTTFVFTAAEADSFASKRLDPPKRCPDCRRARRAQKAQGDHRDGPPRGHFGGDVNGYRSPMSDPSGGRDARGRGNSEYRAPGFRDSRPSNSQRPSDAPRSQGSGEYRAPSFAGDRGPRGGGDYRAPAYGGDRSPRGSGDYRAPSFGGDRGGDRGPRAPRNDGEYRAPSFGGDRGGDRGPRPSFGADRGDDRGPRPAYGADRGGDRGPRAPYGADRGGDRGPRPDRGPSQGPRRGPPRGGDRRGPGADSGGAPHEHRAAPRPDRPSFPITCAQCGVASEVPFKPQEGREILCRDCYRAKKDGG